MLFSTATNVETIGYASESDIGYEFNEFVVLQQGDIYYWASDSGCSCPSPFDSHDFPRDFESGNAIQALNALDEWGKDISIEDTGLRTRLMNAGSPATDLPGPSGRPETT